MKKISLFLLILINQLTVICIPAAKLSRLMYPATDNILTLVGLYLLLSLPTVLCILCLIFAKRIKRLLKPAKIVAIIAIVPVFIGTLLFSMNLPVKSATNDIANLGKYDSNVYEYISADKLTSFPVTVPDGATDKFFEYTYSSKYNESFLISYGWTLNGDALENAVKAVEDEFPSVTATVHSSTEVNTYNLPAADGNTEIVFTCDRKTGAVTYKIELK